MVEEPKRTIAYLCPSCRQSVVVEKTVFSLAAAPSAIPCPCGKAALKTEIIGDRVKLTVPCLFCEKEHTVSCSTHAFLHEKTLAFSCAASGLDCCYVGEGTFIDDVIMHEVLSEIRDIAQRGGISCACGSKEWKLQVNFSSVDLFCARCGAALRIPAATADDLEDICCKPSLLIHGKEV